VKFLLDHDVPDDVVFPLKALGHEVAKLRDLMPGTTPDDEILRVAHDQGSILITCNRDDFLDLAARSPHRGIIILIRRRSRVQERVALIRLLDSAGPAGIVGNINFA
jgi:predicted nuclease of predicted toxin-antitoxin system